VRHRSLTNSDNETNEQLRREYVERHGYDEAYRWLCEALDYGRVEKVYSPLWGAWIPDKFREVPGRDPHHIHGGYTGRWDLWSNLICVCRSTHDWLTDNTDEGRVICLYAKWRKAMTGNPEDFDIEELRTASGKNYPEYIETLKVSGRLQEMRDEMVEHFRAKGAA
jgi:hypothetical protein